MAKAILTGGSLSRIDVYALTGLTADQVQGLLMEGRFPRPYCMLFGHQARWHAVTVKRWMKLNPDVLDTLKQSELEPV